MRDDGQDEVQPRRGRGYLWALVFVVPLAIVGASQWRAQPQVELATRFLASVRRGELDAAQAVAADEAQRELRALRSGAGETSGVRALRESAAVDVGWNTTVSAGARCVEATLLDAQGDRRSLYVQLDELSAGWRVTRVMLSRPLTGPCNND